jgi:regulator of protease activity HflC (stomatin/prohibitin superfamily)
MAQLFGGFLLPLFVFLVLLFASAVKVLREYERAVIFRLGRLIAVKGPGLILLIPFVDKMVRVSLRTETLDVPPQDVITRDNCLGQGQRGHFLPRDRRAEGRGRGRELPLRDEPDRADHAASVLRQADLDEILSEREKLNQNLQKIIDQQTEPWGVKVGVVEIKAVDLPQEMQRAIARQAEAERERRAKVINADGEFQAAQRLADAAKIIATEPAALQLRYLQTLAEIATENNSTTIFPVPIDLLKAFMGKMSTP